MAPREYSHPLRCLVSARHMARANLYVRLRGTACVMGEYRTPPST